MYLVQKNHVRWQSVEEYRILLRLARLSKNVYNTALWHIKNHFINNSSYLSYTDIYALLKGQDSNYIQLPSQTAQQTLKYIDRAIQSFFELLKLKKQGNYKEKIQFPYYKSKRGYFTCVFPKQQFKILDDKKTVRLSLGRYFTTQYNKRYLYFTLPDRLIDTKIKEVRLVPQWQGHAFDIEYVYQATEEQFDLNSNKFLSIDLGLDNFATCVSSTNVTTNEPAFILEGRGLKSYNRWWNKVKSNIQSIKDKQQRKHIGRKELQILSKKRSVLRNYTFQSVNYVIKHCLTHEIGTIVIGELPDIKRKMTLGKKTNQHFQAIPIGKFKQQLETKCKLYGIQYTEVNEAYTSQTCANCGLVRKANRIKRGLYRCCQCGLGINADVNGAINIGKKVAPNGFDYCRVVRSRWSSGRVNRPKRIRLVAFGLTFVRQ